MLDLWGHASIRVPKSERILVTPRFGKSCLPRTIRAEHMLVTDMSGRLVEGRGELPRQFAADVALYQGSKDSGACIFASPQTAMAAAIARYRLQPLTHMEAEIAYGMGGAAGMARIYRHLPRAEAMKLVLTGDAIDAQEAYRINLVNEVVDDEGANKLLRRPYRAPWEHPAPAAPAK